MKFIISFIICSLCILQAKGDKASVVIEFAKSKLGCGYIWSGYGQKLTQALLDQLYNKYPTHIDKSIVKKWIGKQVYDCSGLVHVAFQQVNINLIHHADSAWKQTSWMTKGTISNYPKDKVLVLYRKNSEGTMVHTGIYIGGGKCIHAKGSAYGVVKDNMPGSWTHWGIPKGLY